MSEVPAAEISARRLLAWADLDEARRRRAQRGPLALPGWGVLAGAGGLLAAEAWRRAAEDLAAASALWTLGVAAAATLAAMGAPFRLYWRRDASLVARLPIPGGVLYRAAFWRSVRAGGGVLLVALPGLAVLVTAGGVAYAMRHSALALAGAATAALLSPAAALAAGAMIASERAQAAVASMAGEIRTPPTAWLGMLPGAAAAAIALAVLSAGGWAREGDNSASLALLVGLVAAAAAAATWAMRTSARTMPAALREISALDRDRLAHVERVGPSWLERLWGRILARGKGARAVYEKDATLLRRRYPMVYVASAVGIGALWIVAVTRPDEYLAWSVGILSGLGAYAVVVARRVWSPPVEHPRYLRSLAVAPSAARSAKGAGASLRVVVPALLGGAVVLFRAGDPAYASWGVVGASAAGLAAVLFAARSPS